MELLVNPIDYKNAQALIDLKVHQLLIGLKDFSIKSNCHFSFQEIEKLNSIKKSTKIIVLINKLFYENEISSLTDVLKKLATIGIDGIVFHDYAIPQIIYEQKITGVQLTYNPETLITSYGQLQFYQDNNFSEVVLARELFYGELFEIGSNNQTLVKLQIHGQGYNYIMHSRWNLLTNFEQSTKQNFNLKNKKLYLRELSRKLPNIVYEDDAGTYMYSGYQTSLINMLDKLEKANINTIRYDTLFNNAETVLGVSKLYLKGLSLLESGLYTDLVKKQLFLEVEKLLDSKVTNNFYGDLKDLLHLERSLEVQNE